MEKKGYIFKTKANSTREREYYTYTERESEIKRSDD